MLQQGCRNRTCRNCAAPLGYISLNILCDDCRKKNLEASRAKYRRSPSRVRGNDRQRARHYGVQYEPIDRLKVYARDGWICKLCHKKVDPKLKNPHLMSASLDHIVPMSLGGDHLYVNVQLAHMICNSRKCNFGYGDQLALIG